MRGFFDDLLAAIFVLAILAASYVFLFSGSVQSGTMMSQALTHRIKIEQLRSAAFAFRQMTEPNTGENLAELIGTGVHNRNSKVWVGDYAVDTRRAAHAALENLLGKNFKMSVEIPTKQLDLVLIIPQSPTLWDEKNELVSSIPQIREQLEGKGLNASITLYFLTHTSCSSWCDNSTQEVVFCSDLQLNSSLQPYLDWAGAVEYISSVQSQNLKLVIPIADSLPTGNFADSCYGICPPPDCTWCNSSCGSEIPGELVQKAVTSAQTTNTPVCPIFTEPCVSVQPEVESLFSCQGIGSIAAICDSSCPNCKWGEYLCVGEDCTSEIKKEMAEISAATGCDITLYETDISQTITSAVETALNYLQFEIGYEPPSDKTIYSEDILLPVTPPLRARILMW